ncbi:MAG TPA: hypothetical protein PLH72_12430 [Vicinamibacterales bacterium]|nr:hypothetical protein [Vicinamibacterales bacterium]
MWALCATERLEFGADYLMPKPFDPRAIVRVASAVAGAATASGVAGVALDLDEYPRQLTHRLGRAQMGH